VSAASATALTVAQVGLEWPRSIIEKWPTVTPAAWARASWVMPRSVRGWRIALPRAGWAGAGLRNGEACALDWPDFDPASGTLRVAASKTDAGVRRVDLPDALRGELTTLKLRSRRSAEGPMFRNRNGQRQSVSNVERRFKTAIRRANRKLAEIGLQPIDEAVTPHSLRRLYASLRFALGDDPVYVAAQLGHTEPGFSMKVYASAVRRRERLVGAALREFDAALDWAAMGSGERVSVESELLAGGEAMQAQQRLFR
jgi:integrase